MMMIYPLKFHPILKQTIWGGDKINQLKQISNGQPAVGESWEISAVEGFESVVANGTYRGYTLRSLVRLLKEELVGADNYARFKDNFPLLVKFIDAHDDLSVQVHPDDGLAMQRHHCLGKTEMWYVLGADKDAHLIAGFSQKISPKQYREMVADGSFVDALYSYSVKPGDVYYIPAGRVHSLGKGTMVAEVQETSDITYRIFDYNRPGMDGKPRELHTALAAEALDFHVEDEYRTQYSDVAGRANRIIDSPYFSVRVTEMTSSFHRNLIKYDSFIISMCIKGDCTIRMRTTGDEILLREGHSTLIPAAIADYDVIPLHGKTRILDAYIDNMDRSVGSMITRFLHISEK